MSSKDALAGRPGMTEGQRKLYVYGSGSVFSYRKDPRFSYCMYVPPEAGANSGPLDLVVAVHGTFRAFTQCRDAFAEFGRWHRCAILAPLFPVGPLGDDNMNGYKMLKEDGIRYDHVLLGMVEELSDRIGHRFDRFALFGYSGGGQFANRFGLLHPERLWALSIGAPGMVTLIDPDRDWWVGTRGAQAEFGKSLDLDALRRLPVQMVVGKADLETWEITLRPGDQDYMDGANDAGATRPERLQALRESFERAGVNVRFDVLPNVAHDWTRSVGPAQGFLSDCLKRLRA